MRSGPAPHRGGGGRAGVVTPECGPRTVCSRAMSIPATHTHTHTHTHTYERGIYIYIYIPRSYVCVCVCVCVCVAGILIARLQTVRGPHSGVTTPARPPPPLWGAGPLRT